MAHHENVDACAADCHAKLPFDDETRTMVWEGAAWQNGYAECLIRTIKDEEVDLSEYEDYHDAMTQLGQFLDDVYMHKRIHSSLGYLTPVEFEAQWRAQQASASSIP